MSDASNEVASIMADLGISPSSPRSNSVSRGPQTFNLTPANAAPVAYGGQSYTMTPANAAPQSYSLTPANASGPSTYNFTPANASGPQTYNLTPANAGGPQTYNLTPANASGGGGAQFVPSSGPGVQFAAVSSGPGGAQFTPSSGPGMQFATVSSGPGAPFTPSSGPGAQFTPSSGPGMQFAAVSPSPGVQFTPSSGPGAQFALSSGPGATFTPSSGPGAAFVPSSGPGAAFVPSSGPGAAFVPSSGPGPRAVGASSGPGFAAISAQPDNDRGIQMANRTPDGREIIHKGPPCAQCGEMVIGQCINALGKSYHPDHFVCACCSQPFKNGKFMIKDNEPYCETDYFELFGNRCRACGEPLREKYIQAQDLFFHPEHFVCHTCGKGLAGQKYKVQETEERDVLCIDCHVKRIVKLESQKICAKCKTLISGEWIILKGQHMHPEHFRCAECGCAFVGGNCHEYEGELYCLEHYELMLKKACYKCGKPILGRGINACGRMWHPEHFGCTVCQEVLSATQFFERDGQPYCNVHYTQLFGVVCAKCEKPILGHGKTFLDKQYHEEHFCCHVCEKLLKPGHIREWDSKPYCDKCYDKLPSELRKRYEKKKNADAKSEKVRDRDARRAEKEKAKKEKEKGKSK